MAKEKEMCLISKIDFSRRWFLKGAGALLIGTIASKILPVSEVEAKKRINVEKWPWPYVKLDPTETAELAYKEWYRLFCGGAVISSVFSQLRKKVGAPYTYFPIEGFIFAEGGIAGWGTICGSLLGANIVANLIIGPHITGNWDGELMGSEIMEWYTKTELPIYVPKHPKVPTKEIPRTISNSPLCHISVGKWMKVAKKSLHSPERRDRCARLTASVAYHLVELLNKWKDGKYEAQGWIPSSEIGITAQYNCVECHGSKVPTPPR